MSVHRHIPGSPIAQPAISIPRAANDRLLVQAGEPSLRTLLADLGLVRGFVADGLTPRHLAVLAACAAHSTGRAFRDISGGP